MPIKTDIEWCDSIVTPVLGPSRKAQAPKQFMPYRNLGTASLIAQGEPAPGRIAKAVVWPDLVSSEREDKPWLSYHSRLVLIADAADAFSPGVTFEYLQNEVILNIASPQGAHQHWLWHTHFPRRMAEFASFLDCAGIEWPENLWAGTSIISRGDFHRVDELLQFGSSTTRRFVHIGPQAEQLKLSDRLQHLQWVIQSGAAASAFGYGAGDWLREVQDECRQYEVAYFRQSYRLPRAWDYLPYSDPFSSGRQNDPPRSHFEQPRDPFELQQIPRAAVSARFHLPRRSQNSDFFGGVNWAILRNH